MNSDVKKFSTPGNSKIFNNGFKPKKPPILIVEDDYSSQRLLYYFLKSKYELHFAPSNSAAKQILTDESIVLIFLDLSLVNRENGLDLVDFIRSSNQWKYIPVIATTSQTQLFNKEKCLLAGCMDYLSKPIKQDVLLDKISTWS